jgi:hypothetical protein
MREAGISNKGLAAQVAAEMARKDLPGSPDHTYVKRWLDGVQPVRDTAVCIAAALSRRVGRRLGLDDLGFHEAAARDSGLAELGVRLSPELGDAVADLENLTRAGLSGEGTLAAMPWNPDAGPALITGYLFGTNTNSATVSLPGDGSPGDRIRATLRHLTDLDFQFGGGHTKGMLLYYWQNEIVPLLRQRHPEHVRRDVFAAAADAAEVLGWSAYDAGHHGAAQRFYAQGLRLAREAGDDLMGGQILSNLSHQANYLGSYPEALQFARAAQAAISKVRSPTVASMFLAMEARALASIGDARGCRTVLGAAQEMFDQRNPENDPSWISYFDEFELAGEAAHCFRDLNRPAEAQEFALQAIDQTATPPRTRAFILMVNAAGTLQGGELEEATRLASNGVTLAGTLTSTRYLRYVSDFRRLLRERHGGDPAAVTFDDLLRERGLQVVLEGPPR